MVVQLASPYDAQRIQQMAAQKAKFQPNPQPVAAPQKGPLQTVGETAGANIAGKVGEAAGTKALGKLGTAFAQGKYGAAVTGANPLMGGLTAAGSMALPWLAGAAVLGKAFKLFNSGGQVGPLAPQYKEGGGSAWSQDPLYKEWKDMYDDPTIDLSADDDFRKRMFELENILKEKYGGQMHVYKEHGGMTMPSGPLSNNRSVKMTIEYKN